MIKGYFLARPDAPFPARTRASFDAAGVEAVWFDIAGPDGTRLRRPGLRQLIGGLEQGDTVLFDSTAALPKSAAARRRIRNGCTLRGASMSVLYQESIG